MNTVPSPFSFRASLLLVFIVYGCPSLHAAEQVEHPYAGIELIARTETAPRAITLHVVRIELTAPGLSFKLTAPNGTLETVRQSTLDFLRQEHAQLAINAHYFLPFPSETPDAMLIGLAASNGNVFSAFESPVQSYALVTDAPAINLARDNEAAVVHRDPAFPDGKHILEKVSLWNTVSGSAQIVTDGVRTLPAYSSDRNPKGALTPGGPATYSYSKSWYDQVNARSAIGLTRDNRTLVLLVVDRAGTSMGMTVGEVADLLVKDYAVFNALNLDGGGSSSLAMENPRTHAAQLVNASSDNPLGRSVGSNLAIFAAPLPAQNKASSLETANGLK